MGLLSGQLWRTAGAALCVLLIASEAAAGICLEVDVTFAGRDPSPVTVQSMQSEASAIWQRYGVQLQWPPSRHDVQCLRVHGTFDVLVEYQASPVENASGSSVLGSTHLAPAAIDRARIFVDYDETEHLLESLSASRLIPLVGHPDIGPADIGRALGRVLAHEIGHVLLDAPRHQPWGLMRRSFAPDDLAARQRWSYTLSKKEVERLASRERDLNER
jgi:hypothetical protein